MKKIIGLMFLILLLSGCVPQADFTLEAGKDTIEVFENHVLNGCTATIDEVSYSMDVVENPVDTQVVGEYIVRYETEVNNSTYTCQRVVFVIDRTSPEATLNPGLDTIFIGQTWQDAGITVIDNYDQEIQVIVNYSSFGVDGGNPMVFLNTGMYEVEYTAIDESGNETRISRFVHVIEGE